MFEDQLKKSINNTKLLEEVLAQVPIVEESIRNAFMTRCELAHPIPPTTK